SCRAAAAASGQCVHGHSLLPKPDPTNLLMTRTFSCGRPNICARTPRRLTTPCDDSYRVSVDPSQIAVVACSSSGLCVSVGVTYVWSSLTGADANAASASPRRLCTRLTVPNVVTTSSGSSSAFSSVSTFGFSLAYVTRTASAAPLAASNVSATASATYWP